MKRDFGFRSAFNEGWGKRPENDKNTLAESYLDSGIFSEEESIKIADMLLKKDTVQKGGDCTPSNRIVARYIIVTMAALLVFIIFQIVK